MKVFILFQPDGRRRDFIGVFSTYEMAVNAVYSNFRLHSPPMQIETWEVDGRRERTIKEFRDAVNAGTYTTAKD